MTKHVQERRSPWVFIALAYTLSWLLWVPAAVFGRDYTSSLWAIPYILGGFGPSVAGIILVHRNRDEGERRAFWRRVVDPKLISVGWYLFIFLVVPAIVGGSVLIGRAVTGSAPELRTLAERVANPGLLVGLIIFNLLGGPISEELGWRGVGLDRLLERWSPLAASLITAPFWFAWHAPLFFMVGTSQHSWGLGTADFWFYFASVVPLSVLVTWCAIENRRSILAAILIHFVYNLALSMVFPVSTLVFGFSALLLSVAAVGVVLVTGLGGRKRLIRNHTNERMTRMVDVG
jgi:membrane protease YdiL (CAAX protease family)